MGGSVRDDDQTLAPLDALCSKAKPRGFPQIVASKPGIKVALATTGAQQGA
jgi:hypothetical protein